MNTKQRDFLNELGTLFERYNVKVVTFTKGACFESDGEILVFDEYQNGEFTDVRVRTGNYKPVIEACYFYTQK